MAVLGLLALLYTLAETIRCGAYTHDVQVRRARLKLQYAAQLASEQASQPVMIVDEELPLEEAA